MKLLGTHNRVRVISNSSSRTSPSKNTEPSQAQNRLLVCDVLEEVSGSSDGSKCSSAINKTEALEKDPPLDINKVEDMTKSSVQQPVVSSSMEERKQQRRIQHQDISRDRLPPSGMMLRNGLLISKMFNKISLRAHHRTRVHSR